MVIPNSVKFIINTLNNAGFEAFVVGGCVRDSIMKISPKDFDITTNATPAQVKSLFKHTVDTGIEHGTVTVVLNKVNYEVTTYRIDGKYEDNRRPKEVLYTNSLHEDLLRRDFTINAIAYHWQTGFTDPFSGIKDIELKTIRGVGNPDLRFKEDALRMLRAIRFSAQLNFEIEPETYFAVKQNAELIKNISIERVRDELVKLLMTSKPEQLLLFIETGLCEYVNKQLYKYLSKNFNKAPSYAKIKACKKEIVARLALLFMFCEKDEAVEMLKFLKFSNAVVKEFDLLLSWIYKDIANNYYEIRKALSNTDVESFSKIIYLKKIVFDNFDEQGIREKLEFIVENKHCISLKTLAVNGNDIKQFNIKDGKEIGKILNILLDYVLKQPENNLKEKLLPLVEKR